MLPQTHCDNKMLLIPSSTANQWPQKQIHIDDPKATPMEKQPQQQQQQQQQALKCPRCDSSNTKFCYYNNYSLSQPRHFCKACKRYWTRGGTLRNVPVGGGCRKNKRVKRPNNSATSSSSIIDHHVMPSTSSSNPNPNIDLSSSSNHVNPLFYGLPTNPSELNLPFPRFNSRVSSTVDTGGYDLQPQMNALGLGFSSSGLIMGSDHHHVPNSNSILSSYPIFGSSISSSTSPSMASLIASSLQQQRFMSLNSYDEDGGNFGKEVKMEATANRLDWNFNTQNQIGQIGSSDPNSLVWNTSDVGAWLDPTNIGSSVPSLI